MFNPTSKQPKSTEPTEETSQAAEEPEVAAEEDEVEGEVDPEFEELVRDMMKEFLDEKDETEYKFDCSHYSKGEKLCIRKVLKELNIKFCVKSERHTDFIVATKITGEP